MLFFKLNNADNKKFNFYAFAENGNLGNATQSLTEGAPVTYLTNLSNPIPIPPCGNDAFRLVSI